MSRDPGVLLSSRHRVVEHEFDVDVQERERLLASYVPRIGVQEAVKGVPSQSKVPRGPGV